MRLVAATRILNEQDIVEAFVRHTAAFVDHHVLLDNGSIDGTLDILGKLRGEGLQVSLYGTASLSFNEVESGTFLFRTAVTAHGADWVLMLDTDEFIDGRHIGASLRDYLAWVSSSLEAQSWSAIALAPRLTSGFLDGASPPWRHGARDDARRASAAIERLAREAASLPGHWIEPRVLDVADLDAVASEDDGAEEIRVRSLVRGAGELASSRGLLVRRSGEWTVNGPLPAVLTR